MNIWGRRILHIEDNKNVQFTLGGMIFEYDEENSFFKIGTIQ